MIHLLLNISSLPFFAAYFFLEKYGVRGRLLSFGTGLRLIVLILAIKLLTL